jgi:hypothetical protein
MILWAMIALMTRRLAAAAAGARPSQRALPCGLAWRSLICEEDAATS